MIAWFQGFAFSKCNLYRYNEAREREAADKVQRASALAEAASKQSQSQSSLSSRDEIEEKLRVRRLREGLGGAFLRDDSEQSGGRGGGAGPPLRVSEEGGRGYEQGAGRGASAAGRGGEPTLAAQLAALLASRAAANASSNTTADAVGGLCTS